MKSKRYIYGNALVAHKTEAWKKCPSERIANELSKPNYWLPIITEDRFSGDSQLCYNGLMLTSKSKEAIEAFGESTGQVLDYILLKAKEAGNFKGFIVSVSDFMERRGLHDRKSAAKQLKEGLTNLANVRIDYSPLGKKKKGKKTQIEKLYDHIGTFTILANIPTFTPGSKNIPIVINPLYSPVLKLATPFAYHEMLLKINTRLNPWAYPLGRKIFEHKAMSARWRASAGSGEGCEPENILKVATLLKAAGLPFYDNVTSIEKRSYRTKVINCFERDLNALNSAFTWEYCYEKGELIPPGEVVKAQDFDKLSILFHFKDYPMEVIPGNSEAALIEAALFEVSR